MKEKVKILKTKKKEDKGLTTNLSSPHFYLPKDPHQYEGEVLVNQGIKSKKTHKKQLYIESCVCP